MEGPNRMVVFSSDSIFIVMESLGQDDSKSFMGVTWFPPLSPKNKGVRVEVHNGLYDRGPKNSTLKKAREERNRIRMWSKETSRNPRANKADAKKIQKKKLPLCL